MKMSLNAYIYKKKNIIILQILTNFLVFLSIFLSKKFLKMYTFTSRGEWGNFVHGTIL